MKKYVYLALFIAIDIAWACSKSDTDLPDLVDDPEEITINDVLESDPEDFVENATFTSTVTIKYSGNNATVSSLPTGVSVSCNGADVTITSSIDQVEYILSGTSPDGMFKLYSDKKFKLTLNTVNLTNPDGPAINIQSGKRAYVVQPDNTTNTLTDGTSYTSSGSEDMKACFFSEGQLVFSGTGSLNITANYKHGICSDDYVRIRAGVTLSIQQAVKDGIHANDYVLIDGGTLHINASGDGIECEKGCIEINGGEITINSTDDGIVASCEDNDYTISPFIKINGGNLTITTSGQKGMAIKSESNTTINGGDLRLAVSGEASKGIKSGGHVVITGGTLDITTTGNAFYESNDISSAAGIKCDGSFKITNPGTTLTITSSGSAGKGINCDGTLTIENCTVNVTTTGKPYIYGRLDASAKGIKSDGNLTIKGSNITVKTTGGENSEGIESKATLTIESGTIEVIAYDDCINAANAIVINGGMTYCYSSNNDGIDSNGTLTITGGTVIASGTTMPEEGFDCDQNTFTITGGIIIGTGGSTSTPTTKTCTQHSLVYGTSGTEGQIINIQSPDGTSILTYQLPRSYTQLTFLFSSPSLAANTTYTVSTGGSVAGGSEFHGLHTNATYTGGSSVTTFTTNSMVTSVGSTSGGGGRPNGPGSFGGDWGRLLP